MALLRHTWADLKKPQAWGCLLFALAMVSVLIGLFYAGRLVAHSRASYWIFVPLAILVGAFWWLAAFLLPLLILTSGRRRVLENARYTMSMAQMSIGARGTTFQNGPIAIWASGPGDPIPMLIDEIELVRSRLSALLGRPIEPRAPLRIYWFDQRDSLERYHRALSLATGNSAGGYIPAPARMITISLEGALSRLHEPKRWARYLAGFYWLEIDEGFLPPFWLREAVAFVLAANAEGQVLARLNRRMLGSLRSGGALGAADLFQVKEKTLVQPGRSWASHDSFTKLSQWSPQSWSVGEYLVGDESTHDHRARSVAFLNDLHSSEGEEEVFERHFGYRYDRLLEDWRTWVLEHGEGAHAPPAAEIRDVLEHELIPTIRNSRAIAFERVHAVRIMGMEGYAMGADTLIDLLRTGGEIPREELVWALESISGLTLGDDPEAWQTWWQSVPEHAKLFTGSTGSNGQERRQ